MFDKVVVLYEGRQIYFGPCNAAKDFFVRMGFDCPPRQTAADFLTSLTSLAERIVRSGFKHKVPRSPDKSAARCQHNDEHQALLRDIETFNNEFTTGDGRAHNGMLANHRLVQSQSLPARSPHTISAPL